MARSDCPISCTLDIIGDKWTLIIIRDALFKGCTTYGQFQSSTEGIATNILAARLSKMVENGIFTKSKDDSNKLKVHYRLTQKGRDLEKVLMSVAIWGNSHIDGTYDVWEKIREAKKTQN